MFNYKLTSRKKLQIFPLGDLHIGSPQFNEEFLNYWIKFFKGSKSEKVIYLQGDLIDVATKRLGNSTFEQKMNVNDQLETLIKYLKPLKKYIKGSVIGNHELRSVNEFDLNISKLMADILDCEYGNSLYHEYRINDIPYKIFAQHGNRTSNQLHLMLGQVMRSTQHIDANLILYGHCHYGESMSLPNVTLNGFNRKNIVLTGHFLKYEGGYAEVKGLKPNPCCFTVVNIGHNADTNVNVYNEDELIKK